MDRASNHRLRPPSPSPYRLPQNRPYSSLTIRTTDNHPVSAMAPPVPSSSPASQTMNYPIPIPAEKLEKALKLYTRYRTEEALAQRETQSPYLDITSPFTPTLRSGTSVRSSKRGGTSISASMNDVTDMTSVVSFDGTPSTGNEFVGFNGQKVKTRVRRQFDPAGKAKTALVRWLGSCPRCRERRVPCSLNEHHDIATLERLHAERQSEDTQPSLKRSRSSGSNSSQRTARSHGRLRSATGPSQTAFLGIGSGVLGQSAEYLQPYSLTDVQRLDLQSPGGLADELNDIAPTTITDVQYPAIEIPQLYSGYDNGMLLHIGLLQDSRFYCQYQGECDESFDDQESALAHFEQVHFHYTRLDDPVQYFCSGCNTLCNSSLGPCQTCGFSFPIFTWICGLFYRAPPSVHFPADGPAPMPYDSSSIPYTPVPYSPSNPDGQWHLDPGSDYASNMEPYGDNTPSYHSFGGDGNITFDYNNSFHGSDNGWNGERGSGYSGQQMVAKPVIVSRFEHLVSIVSRPMLSLLFIVLMLLMLFIFCGNWGFNDLSRASPQVDRKVEDQLPKFGFLLMLASFSASLHVKHFLAKRTASQLLSSSPFDTFSPYTSKHRQKVPGTHMRYTGYL